MKDTPVLVMTTIFMVMIVGILGLGLFQNALYQQMNGSAEKTAYSGSAGGKTR